MFTKISQDLLLTNLNKTLKLWEERQHLSFTAFNLADPYPICQYIQSCVKYSFIKGNLSKTCGYCPVYYLGYIYTCKMLLTLPLSNLDLTHTTFNNIVALTITNFKNTISLITNPTIFNNYYKFVVQSKQKISNSTIVSTVPIQPKRIQKKHKLKV